MLRRLLAVSILFLTAAAAQAAEPSANGITGLFLTTRYPALTIRAGDTTTLDLSLHNMKLPPQTLTVSVPEIASGWKASILGGGQPVGAVAVTTDGEQSLQLRLETFNLFNHANLYVNGNSADMGAGNTVNACYGCTGSTYDRRHLQLAAKVIW